MRVSGCTDQRARERFVGPIGFFTDGAGDPRCSTRAGPLGLQPNQMVGGILTFLDGFGVRPIPLVPNILHDFVVIELLAQGLG